MALESGTSVVFRNSATSLTEAFGAGEVEYNRRSGALVSLEHLNIFMVIWGET